MEHLTHSDDTPSEPPRGQGQRHRCALAGPRPRGRLGRRRAEPDPHRARQAPDARARPRRRGGDLLRAVGQRALVARGRDARGACGRLPRLPAGCGRAHASSRWTSPWTCSRSASGARRSSRICRARACSGPGPPGSTTPSRPGTRGSSEVQAGRAADAGAASRRGPAWIVHRDDVPAKIEERPGRSFAERPLGAAAGSRTTGLQHVTIAPARTAGRGTVTPPTRSCS